LFREPEIALWEMRLEPKAFLMSVRGREMAGRTSAIKKNVMALDRLSLTIMVADAERAQLDDGASAVGPFFSAVDPDPLRVAGSASVPAQHA
jgi:hypothetical protein